MRKSMLKFLALSLFLLSGCLTKYEAEDMATKWAAQMGYEDAKIVCQDVSHEMMSWGCSIATNHVKFPIPLTCTVNGCVISSQ